MTRKQHNSFRHIMYVAFTMIVVVSLLIAYGIVSYAGTDVYSTTTATLSLEESESEDPEIEEEPQIELVGSGNYAKFLVSAQVIEGTVVTAEVEAEEAVAETETEVEEVAEAEVEVEEEVEADSKTEVEAEVAYTMWASASLNVRSGAGKDYSIIGSYSYGDKVSVISSENGWSKVKYGENIGYVSSDYLSETELTPKKSYNGIYEGDTLSAVLTYYCSCSYCCGKSDGITASGEKVHDGVVACNWLPLGTIVSIDGVQYTVADRGGSSFNTVGRFDVYTSAGHQAALNKGKTYTNVTIVSLP